MKINLIVEQLGVPTLSRATCHNNTVFQDPVLHMGSVRLLSPMPDVGLRRVLPRGQQQRVLLTLP
jgi:hypothetical protein